ncbi:hypothetical protein MKW92_044747 [Papaver armeniacum]|nr:hypothetical protein MKW92_044747 [Papaver armeniacum]
MGNWNWFWKAGPSGFKASSTSEEVTEEIDATGLTAIVTSYIGIGKETTRVLALRGVKVIIPSRNLENGLKTKEMILQENPKAKLDYNCIHNISLTFSSRNNARIMACPFQLSKDGIELQFATNHLGHFLLTKLLMDKLKTTAKKSGIEGRIVNMSSTTHRRLFVKEDSLLDLEIIHDPTKSKLANVIHANELASVFQAEKANVTENSLHPGVIPTNLFQFMNFRGIPLPVLGALGKPFMKNIPQGASTTCYVALHPNLKGVTGKYFNNCNEKLPSAQAQDKDLGKKLWDFSTDLLNNLNKRR